MSVAAGVVCRGAGVEGRAAFGDDELLEPADLALGALLAVLLEGRGCSRPCARGAACEASRTLARRSSRRERRPSRMRSRTCGLGAGEEGEADVEVVVVPGVRAAGRDEVLEVLLAVGRQLVDDARPLAAAVGRARWSRGSSPSRRSWLQRRVERAVGQRAEDAERGGEALAQLVAVQRAVVEQAEDRELEQRGAAALRAVGLRHLPRYTRIYRCDTSTHRFRPVAAQARDGEPRSRACAASAARGSADRCVTVGIGGAVRHLCARPAPKSGMTSRVPHQSSAVSRGGRSQTGSWGDRRRRVGSVSAADRSSAGWSACCARGAAASAGERSAARQLHRCGRASDAATS